MQIQKLIEIRPGAGGQESENLVQDLCRVYCKYCDNNKINIEMFDDHKRMVTMIISGKEQLIKAFDNEIGVHKFQRVPKTEKKGRVHTSTVAVAVLTIDKDAQTKKYYNDKDIRIDEYRASGAGGQHVNKTSSAIRVTHIPSGTVVTCQNERSQLRNKETALLILNTKLKNLEEQERMASVKNKRKNQIGQANRNEARRIYNEQREEIVDNILNVRKKYKTFFKGELFYE